MLKKHQKQVHKNKFLLVKCYACKRKFSKKSLRKHELKCFPKHHFDETLDLNAGKYEGYATSVQG